MKRIQQIKPVERLCIYTSAFETSFLTIILTLFGLVGFLIIGCAPKPKILLENRTPENVLKCALENKAEYETFAGLLDLKLKGKEAKFSGTIEFYYQAPGTFVFYPRTFFGVGMFKAKGEDDSITIYFPKENEYYSGSFSDLEKTRLWNWKISLKMLLDMILGRGGPAEQNVRYAGNSKDVFLYKFEDENWIKEYWVDALRCRLKKSQLTKKREKESYQIEYQNFVTYKQAEIPKVVKTRSLTKDSAQIKFLERRFDFPIPKNKFEFQIPPDARRVVFETNPK